MLNPLNWTSVGMHPVVAPDVETSRSKNGSTMKIDLSVWVVAAVTLALVAVRIGYHLCRGRRYLWSDDYFLIAALVCVIANGVAIHEWIPDKLEPNVTTAASPHVVLVGSLMGLFNSLAMALGKTSLSISFLRLTSGWWKWSLAIWLFVMNVLFAIQAWSFWVQDCNGPAEPFRMQSKFGGCVSFESVRTFRLLVQILSCGLDVYFMVLPWKIVRPLQLKRFEKIGLGIAMSFGGASLVSGLVRLTVLLRLANQPYEHQPFYSVGGYLFNYFEPAYTINAACIPVLRKVFMDLLKWKKDNLVIRWRLFRRKKRSSNPTLPVTETTQLGSMTEVKSTSDVTDTSATLTMNTTPSSNQVCTGTGNETTHSSK
ncbi:hypothetical protein GGS21DRAFT_2097 [Xylaria nigripes]|nr:hypothetical protein GGS21DRAFT_2097 [Xylaria nigripes]